MSIRKNLMVIDKLDLEKATFVALQHEIIGYISPELAHRLGQTDLTPRHVNKVDDKEKTLCTCGHKSSNSGIVRKCCYCALFHPKGKCPAFNKLCEKCHTKGHFRVCCEQVQA